MTGDRKSTRLNSSHTIISYAVFCLKKKIQHARHALAPRSGTTTELQAARAERAATRAAKACGLPSRRRDPIIELDVIFFFKEAATPEIYPLSLPDLLPF